MAFTGTALGGQNSTEVSYGWGQSGSVFILGTDAVNSYDVDTDAIFCAITFLEDTKFHAGANGLNSTDNTMFPNTSTSQSGIGSNTEVVDTPSVFPKGVTIYGRWTTIQLVDGKVIAYIGR